MKTKLPDNFQPNEGTCKWALIKYQYYDLPNLFLSDFRMHHAAKGERYTDWQRALKNWINWSSPAGKYYNAKDWEKKIQRCKDKQNKEKIKVSMPKMKVTPKPVNRELVLRELKKMRLSLEAE